MNDFISAFSKLIFIAFSQKGFQARNLKFGGKFYFIESQLSRYVQSLFGEKSVKLTYPNIYISF